MFLSQRIFSFALLFTADVLAWSPSTLRLGRILNGQICSHLNSSSPSFQAKQSEDTELFQDQTGKELSCASYGISYIGGDPCGSKYNNDPFDATKEETFKPGFPDDMKDRIAALAAKRLQEQKNDD